ncbi:MAG: HPr family phosphocarrier protein [Clostridiales bacterium]|nr:HPr family phosphocarrier protein [Clostridiales bacterium]
MKKVMISLSESIQIKSFVNIINKYSFDLDLRSGRYLVDAKSILGIFSLDLSKPVELEILSDDEKEIEKFLEEIKPYLA